MQECWGKEDGTNPFFVTNCALRNALIAALAGTLEVGLVTHCGSQPMASITQLSEKVPNGFNFDIANKCKTAKKG